MMHLLFIYKLKLMDLLQILQPLLFLVPHGIQLLSTETITTKQNQLLFLCKNEDVITRKPIM